MKSMAMRTASMAMSKQSAGEQGATMAAGHSPLRPNMACSRSACSVLVGRPVLGPPRCTSTMTSGSSVMTARPIASDFRQMPGPLVAVTPRAPPKDGADGRADGGDLVLGLEGADAEALHLGQVVQDVAGRRDRDSWRRPAACSAMLRGGDQAHGQRLVAGDLAVACPA